jgi:hypothetical protein
VKDIDMPRLKASPTAPLAEVREVFGELQELDLASRLLEVADGMQLHRLLQEIVVRAERAVRQQLPPGVREALVALLKVASRKSVPHAARVLGGMPPVSSEISRLAPRAANVFGIELEGLSPEDQELEVARRFVRFGATAARNAARSRTRLNPRMATRSAVISAARRYAPGLLRAAPRRPQPPRLRTPGAQGGHWVRQGRNIIIVNCPGGAAPSITEQPTPSEPAAPADGAADSPGADAPENPGAPG